MDGKMSDDLKMETLEKKTESNESAAYIYRWSYGEQSLYDRQLAKKKKGHGAWSFLLISLLVFLLAFGGLFGVLWMNGSLPFNKQVGNHLSVTEVANIVKPATVIVYAQGTSAYGTGFFITSDGYIVTNYHVIEGATKISVTTLDETVYSATVCGSSAEDDIAVLKIEGKNLSYLTIGDSSALSDGDTVVAVGHPGGSVCTWSTTQGIVSHTDRVMTSRTNTYIKESHMIQTDAALNHGNSGGPLCNDRGEVVGIVSQKLTDSEGVGLAIPINGAYEIINAIILYGNADSVQSKVTRVRPLIGISGSTVEKGEVLTYTSGESFTASHTGVLVAEITSGGSADGIVEIGDIIYAIDGKSVTSIEEFIEYLYGYKSGDKIKLNIDRMGVELWVTITVGQYKK